LWSANLGCGVTPAYVWASVASKQSLSLGGYFINNSVYDNETSYNFYLNQPTHLANKQTNFCPLLSLPRICLTDGGNLVQILQRNVAGFPPTSWLNKSQLHLHL
jgi:hypothetical protein